MVFIHEVPDNDQPTFLRTCKRAPRDPWETEGNQRESKEAPGGSKGGLGAAKGAQGRPKGGPRGAKGGPRDPRPSLGFHFWSQNGPWGDIGGTSKIGQNRSC